MTLPNTNYATATLVNPTAALTDFSLMVDLSRMPDAWKASVNATDGTRGRVAKDDGTEMAVDWIDFVDGDNPGWLRAKWSGSLATSGLQTVRVYPPNTANAAVALGGTFGQYAAYEANTLGYWPLTSSINDRTGNGNTTTVGAGSFTAGDTAGVAGNATNFDGSSLLSVAGIPELSTTTQEVSMIAIARADFDTTRSWAGIMNRRSAYALQQWSSTALMMVLDGNLQRSTGGSWTGGTYKSWAGTIAPTMRRVCENGVQVNSSSLVSTVGPNSRDFHIGASYQGGAGWLGPIQHVSLHQVERSAAWIKTEHDQLHDQPTFWGVWADNPVASGRRRAMIIT